MAWAMNMGSVAKRKAAEFDELARATSERTLRKRYSDIADCYRLILPGCLSPLNPRRGASEMETRSSETEPEAANFRHAAWSR